MCNKGTENECLGCEPATICNDDGVDENTCCTKFFDVIEFSKQVINMLSPIQSEQLYSIVGFATEVTRNTLLLPPDVALQALDGLEYSGGKINHADAITACQGSFSISQVGDPKSLMILITDKIPSEPQNAPEGSPQEAAQEAASQAKDDGTFIIPVMMQASGDISVAYLRELGSDGLLFGLTNFGLLSSLRNTLLEQISCQEPV